MLSLIALLAALILLALPKANEFFRKPTAAWEPPTPGASLPGLPAGSGQPGYPQAPGQPGYPQSSGEPGYPQRRASRFSVEWGAELPVGRRTSVRSSPPRRRTARTNRPDDTPPAGRPGTPPTS